MLSANEILKRIEKGEIYIDGFTEDRLNPNSYNLTLNDKLLIYDINTIQLFDRFSEPWNTMSVLDAKKENPVKEITIPEDGYILLPGILYLGSTNELTKTMNLVPCIDGRSSIGRLGLTIHVTAGFGDIGFRGKWTLEMTVVHPLMIYPNMEICQISYHEVKGDIDRIYKGKYQDQNGTVESKMYKDFK